METCFKMPLDCIFQRLLKAEIARYSYKVTNHYYKYSNPSFGVLFHCFNAANCLLESFKDKLNDSKNAKILVNSMVSLFIYILHRARTYPERTNDQQNLCQILIVTVRDLLRYWVVRGDVIGGSFFGGGVKYAGSTTQELKKEEPELKVSEAILWYFNYNLFFSFGKTF